MSAAASVRSYARQPRQRRNSRPEELRDRHRWLSSCGPARAAAAQRRRAAAEAAAVSTVRRGWRRRRRGLLRLPPAAQRAIELRERRAAVRHACARDPAPAGTAAGRPSSTSRYVESPVSYRSRESCDASRSATTPASCSVRICGQLLDRDQRVGDVTVRVQRGPLVLRDRLLEARLRRLVVPPDPLGVEERLKQACAERPDDRIALQEVGRGRRSPCRRRPSG